MGLVPGRLKVLKTALKSVTGVSERSNGGAPLFELCFDPKEVVCNSGTCD